MYPLLLEPATRGTLWGGTRIQEEFGFQCDDMNSGEATVLSFEDTFIKNGELKSKTLSEAAEIFGRKKLFGNKAAAFKNFPLTVKLIDAKERLSIKVISGSNTHNREIWYILDCNKNSKIIYGFKQNLSREEIKKRIAENNISDRYNIISVKKGDSFIIDSGVPNAIGNGIFAVVIKQGNGVNYRISDYGRLNASGKPRVVQTEKAIASLGKNTVNMNSYPPEITLYPFGIVKQLYVSDHLTCDYVEADGNFGLHEKETFVSLFAVSGDANISYPSGNIRIKKGDSILIPAGIRIAISGKISFISTHL